MDALGPPGTYVPENYTVASGKREAFRWPYSKNSPWNMPIGTKAVYVPAGITATIERWGDYQDGALIFGVDPNFNVLTRTDDPLATIYEGDYHSCAVVMPTPEFYAGPTPWQVHVPYDFLTLPFDRYAANDANLSSAFVQADESIVQLNYTGRCQSGGPLVGTPIWKFMAGHRSAQEIRDDQRLRDGMGIYGGHGGSALSAHGGNLRKGELLGDQPIRHALSLDIWGLFLFYTDQCDDSYGTCRGYRWPAATNDGAASQGTSCPVCGYYGSVPDFRMGSLLALLPTDTEGEFELRTPEGAQLFHALQDYGAYVVDDTGWRRTDFNMDVEAIQEYEAARGHAFGSSNGGFGQESQQQLDLYHDLLALVTRLHVIANNGPSSIGGGGRPRLPLAPDFAP